MAYEVDGFMQALAKQFDRERIQLRYGMVESHSPTVDVEIAGELVTDVACLDHVSIHEGDQVAMLSVGGDLLIIGVTDCAV